MGISVSSISAPTAAKCRRQGSQGKVSTASHVRSMYSGWPSTSVGNFTPCFRVLIGKALMPGTMWKAIVRDRALLFVVAEAGGAAAAAAAAAAGSSGAPSLAVTLGNACWHQGEDSFSNLKIYRTPQLLRSSTVVLPAYRYRLPVPVLPCWPSAPYIPSQRGQRPSR